MTRAAEGDEEGETSGIDAGGEGATGPRRHSVAKIAGSDPAPDHQARVLPSTSVSRAIQPCTPRHDLRNLTSALGIPYHRLTWTRHRG
jgi:hypothetical protein